MKWRELIQAAAVFAPAWWVWNPGQGGGGGGTVHTDGVTIQGDGSSGSPIAIKQVEHDTTLAGAGTVASPLSVKGWPLPYLTENERSGQCQVTANTLVLFGLVLKTEVSFSTIGVVCDVADGANNCDLGLYNAAGVLVANAGPQVVPSSGFLNFPTLQGVQVIPPGIYFFGFTSAASNFKLDNDGLGMSLFFSTTFGVSVGGAMPATITPPALALQFQGPFFGLF